MTPVQEVVIAGRCAWRKRCTCGVVVRVHHSPIQCSCGRYIVLCDEENDASDTVKILHLLDSPPAGGATVAAENVVYCMTGRMDYVLRVGKPTPLQRAFRTVGGYASVRVLAQMQTALDEHKPDIVHLHNFKEAGTSVIAACKDESVPVVWSCYDYWCFSPRDYEIDFTWRTYQPAKGRRYPLIAKLPLLGRQRRIMRWMNRLDAVIALSEDSKRRLREGGLTVPPIHVVPLPVTVPLSGPPVPDDHLVRDLNLVLFVGGSPPHKGKHIFDAAMKIVQDKRPEVVGKSMFGAKRHRVLREIARAACLVVPEQWPNPGPVVIAETQLLGTPVVASDIGGIREMWPRSLCKANDPEDFAEEIIAVLKSPGPDVVTQEQAHRRHDPAVVHEQLMEVYRLCAIS